VQHERTGSGPCSADASRLSQLVGNLVSNAISYGDANAPVRVVSEVATSWFAIDVHNHGNPIPATAIDGLFEPMTRGTHATSSGRSVGLGLFIVSEITRAHGGRMLVSSCAQRGTSFRAVFPRTEAA
jgi:phosphoserine phosphatase RsbU/P